MTKQTEALPTRSAHTLTQLEGRLYRAWKMLNVTMCREDIPSRETDVLNAAASLVRRWEWLKTQGLWP